MQNKVLHSTTGSLSNPNLTLRKPSYMMQPEGLCIIITGQWGSGKTTLASSMIDSEFGRPVLHVDIEGGTKAIAHLGDDPDYDILPVTTARQVDAITNAFERNGTIDGIPSSHWRTVIWDNETEIAEAKAHEINPSDDPLEIQEFGVVVAYGIHHVRVFRDLAKNRGLNSIFVLWDQPERDKKYQKTGKLTIDMTDKLARRVCGAVDVIGYLEKVQSGLTTTRILYLDDHPSYPSKFRRPQAGPVYTIPTKLVNPSLAPLLDTYVGGRPWSQTESKPTPSKPVIAYTTTEPLPIEPNSEKE